MFLALVCSFWSLAPARELIPVELVKTASPGTPLSDTPSPSWASSALASSMASAATATSASTSPESAPSADMLSSR